MGLIQAPLRNRCVPFNSVPAHRDRDVEDKMMHDTDRERTLG